MSDSDSETIPEIHPLIDEMDDQLMMRLHDLGLYIIDMLKDNDRALLLKRVMERFWNNASKMETAVAEMLDVPIETLEIE